MPNGDTPSTSGKKTYYIIGGIVIVLLLGWLVTRGIGGFMMGAAGVNVNSTPGGATYTDSQGNTATVGTSAKMPDNWPSDAPANYSGAAIVYSGTSNPQTGKAGSAVSYTVRASAQSVADYYKQQLTSAGWTIQGTATMGGVMVVSAEKDTRTFGAYITDSGDGNVSVTAAVGM